MFTARPNRRGQKLAAVAQAFLVDAVADAGRDVPFDRHLQRGQPLRGVEQRLHRDELVLVAMDQQHRRPRLRISAANVVRVDVLRQHQHAGIADDRRRRHGAAQADMQRHHGALAEADQRQRRRRQLAAREFGVEEMR